MLPVIFIMVMILKLVLVVYTSAVQVIVHLLHLALQSALLLSLALTLIISATDAIARLIFASPTFLFLTYRFLRGRRGSLLFTLGTFLAFGSSRFSRLVAFGIILLFILFSHLSTRASSFMLILPTVLHDCWTLGYHQFLLVGTCLLYLIDGQRDH